ncbi:MAG TPA: pseudouridine synthase [Patescibacteria group bacterium]|nr:pseudouridine synthase [Patescibacteria group bacterium]
MSEKITFPLRINRYLALRGITTRRGADELIALGLVTINGTKAKLGDRVMSDQDTIEVLQNNKVPKKEHSYVAYYKPYGVITHSPQRGELSIQDVSGFATLFPVGRLDKASEGLILLTDDGRVTERLLHPRFAHEKEYIVTVR